jgi:trimeric autotransporter adhesin
VPAAATTVSGTLHTADGAAIPGATLRLTDAASGRAWVSWTDESGHFSLPGMSPGHYRLEVAQLGFDPLTKELDVTPQGASPIDLVAKVASLQAIEQQSSEAVSASAPSNASANPAPNAGVPAGSAGVNGAAASSNAASPASPPNNSTESAAATPGAGANPNRGPRGPGGQGRPGGGPGGGGYRGGFGGAGRNNSGAAGSGAAGSGAAGPGAAAPGTPGAQDQLSAGGFQQLALNAQQQQPTDELAPDAAGGNDQSALGQAATSDALLMAGTVGRGADVAPAGGEGPPPGGPDLGGPGGPGGPGGQGGNGANAGGVPGFTTGPGGAPGMNLRVAGGGGRGGRGGAPGGGRPGPQGVAALWGMQRVMRQRANQVHFSLYDQYSNSVFNARPYSLNEANPLKIPTWNDRVGGNVGGPLRIPHIYDGSDRTFFFINFDGSWARNPVDQFSTVPTAFERQNLGSFCDRPGTQLYVPPSGNPSGPRTAVGCQLPSSMFNTASLGLLQFIPVANLAGFVDNYHLQTRVPAQTNRLNTRILHTISPKLNARVIYNFSQTATHSFQSFPSFESNVNSRGQALTLGLTQNLTRTLLNDTQVVFSRNRSQTLNNFANSVNVAGGLGITGVSTSPIDFGVPQLSFTNFTGVTDAIPALTRNQTYRFVDAVTYTRGKHTFQTGAEARRIENNTFSDPTPEGQFTFNGLVTSQLNANGQSLQGTGLDFADFLLGFPYATNVRFGTPSKYYRSWGFIGYATDDWRMKPTFTLEYGVRYEAFTPPSELYGHISNLDVNSGITQAAVVVPGQTAPFSGALPNSLIRGNYNHWAPRIGIAWRPPFKALSKHLSTVRAGYGMFYNESIYSQLLSELANQPPWADSQLRLTSSAEVLTLQNGFPSTGAASNTILNTYAVNPNYKVGYAQIWNLSIETALMSNTTLVLTYTGTKGSNLDLLLAPNRVAPGSVGNAVQVANAGNFVYDTSGANSIYNALQARIQRRMSHGIMVNAIYTFGKSLDDASSIGGGGPGVVVQNDANIRAEYGRSSFDVRQQLRANFVYELPFGEHHRFAQKGFTGDLFGNWRLSSNIALTTGVPFTALVTGTSARNTGSGGLFSTRADQICDPNLPASQQSPLHFFDTSCFVVPPAGQFGDAARNTIQGPGTFTVNFQISKEFLFGKDHNRRLDVRWEVTNLTNTPNLSGLSTLVNSTTFGRVTGASAMRTMDIMTRFNF